MLPKTLAQKMATPATMELFAEHYPRVDTHANVQKGGWELTVMRMLMTVSSNHVFWEAIVPI